MTILLSFEDADILVIFAFHKSFVYMNLIGFLCLFCIDYISNNELWSANDIADKRIVSP